MKTYKQELPELKLKYKSGNFKKVKITNSNEAYITIKEFFDADTIEYSEEMFVLFMNRANNTIGYIKVSAGGTTATITDPKVIMSSALLSGANAMILAHNHPSGNLTPSNADKQVTNKIKKAAALLEIQLLDHLVISDEGYYSLADEGLL
jgi:DNA repair protein RadC